MVEFFELLGIVAFVWIVIMFCIGIYAGIIHIKDVLSDSSKIYKRGYEAGYKKAQKENK